MARKKSSATDRSQEELFLQAFEEYGDALFRHAFLRISDRELAVDVVHDTYAKVWAYVRKGHHIDAYRPFLYKVLNNLIVDQYRKGKEMSLDAIFEQEGVDESAFPELHDAHAEAIERDLDGKQAVTLLEELPDLYREVLILRYVDGLGPKEISTLTEESENVVSVRIHRGLVALKALNAKKEQEAEEKREQSS